MTEEKHVETKCDGCGAVIDPDTCGCGEPMKGRAYHDNHSPIPMGCNCYRDRSALASKDKRESVR